jgi:hypothetical protein
VLSLPGLLGRGHANYCAENQQSVESACRGVFGDGAGCEEIFCRDRTRNGSEEAEFGIAELDSLVAQQRIVRNVDAQAGIGGDMFEREIFGATHSFEEEFAERNGNADFWDDVFFEGGEEIEAAGRIVEDRRSNLRQLALYPNDDLLNGEDAHFDDSGAEALAGLYQVGGFFKLALREGAFAQHHFAEAVLAVAAGGEDELAAVEKKVALDAPEDELELAGEAGGIDFVEQREKLVVRFNFAGVKRKGAAFEPTGRHRDRFEKRILGELLDEAMQAGAIVGAHVHELHAHAVAGAPVADDGARTDFAAGHIEKHFHVGAGGKGMRD